MADYRVFHSLYDTTDETNLSYWYNQQGTMLGTHWEQKTTNLRWVVDKLFAILCSYGYRSKFD